MAKNRYMAKKSIVMFHGARVEFASKLEGLQAMALEAMERRGEITDLELQPQYEIQPSFNMWTTKTKNNKSKTTGLKYTPDFKYINNQGEIVVIEVKGYADTSYMLRKKMFMYQMDKFGVDVFIEIGAKYRHEYRRTT